MIDVALSPVLDLLDIPAQLLPLMFLRAISGSGSLIILQDILESVGPDSYAGRVACVMTGGCEDCDARLSPLFRRNSRKTNEARSQRRPHRICDRYNRFHNNMQIYLDLSYALSSSSVYSPLSL